jgi:hypothetical protein
MLDHMLVNYRPAAGPVIVRKVRKGQREGVINPCLRPELMYLSALGGRFICISCVHRWEALWGRHIDEKLVCDQLLYGFCLSIEGPKCTYDWRKIHFPDGLPPCE